MINRICPNCKTRKLQKHFNSKWCLKCALAFRRAPQTTLTLEQIEEARKLIGKMPREEIAHELGVSTANLKRAFRGTGLAFYNKYAINPKLVKDVCEYYEKNGRAATAKQFPNVNVRSVVERYKFFKPRQKKWTEKEIIELSKMAGLVSKKDQARYFSRPHAHVGSIISVWMKRFGHGGGNTNGMHHWLARSLVTKNCPRLKTHSWSTRAPRKKTHSRTIYLWCDMENHLVKDLPPFIKNAIRTLAHFQRWLFKSQDPRKEIIKMMESRTRTKQE